MASLKQRNVKDEKANAITMFQAKRKLETIFHLFNVFAALFLFSRSSLFPITLQAFSYSLTVLLPLFNNPFYVFLLLNAIILSLYALSNRNATSGDNSKDAYEEFLSNSKIIATHAPVNVPREFTPEKQTVTAVDSSDKAVLRSEAGESRVFNGTVTAVTTHEKTTTTTTCCTTTTTCGVDVVSEKKRYRRVRSESYERRVVVGGGPQLRRMSTTGLGRQLQGRLCHVEQLNKEDFNRAVEDFIANHKRMLWEEQRKSHKTEYLAFT